MIESQRAVAHVFQIVDRDKNNEISFDEARQATALIAPYAKNFRESLLELTIENPEEKVTKK